VWARYCPLSFFPWPRLTRSLAVRMPQRTPLSRCSALIGGGPPPGASRGRFAADVHAGFPAGLAHEPDVLDPDAAFRRLEHVVDREARRGDGDEGLHLSPGPAHRAHARLDPHPGGP